MKSLHLVSKAAFVCLVFFATTFFACNKQETQIPEPPTESLANLKDSASYIIDGKRFTCDVLGSFGSGNEGADRDSITGNFQSDTILYYREFGLNKRTDEDKSDDGQISVTFIKKYAKSQLTSTPPINAILKPKNGTEHYKQGKYPYALDFLRNNRQNGVAISVRKVTGSQAEELISYIKAPYQLSTKITANSQDNSTFEIIRFAAIGDGSYLLEAKFSANLFDNNESPKRIENGYLRLHIN